MLMADGARLLRGDAVAERVYDECKAGVAAVLAERGSPPGLAFVLVGDDPASGLYVGRKQKASGKLGIQGRIVRLAADISQDQLLDCIGELNRDPEIDGILVQQPLPAQIDVRSAIMAVDPDKDVDGFHPANLGALAAGLDTGLKACTPLGIMRLIAAAGVDPRGRQATVIGRSLIVGRPISYMLVNAGATVSICNSATDEQVLRRLCREADILIAATGRPALIGADMVKPGATVIDVGINRDSRGRLCGDVDFDAVRAQAAHLTPVPGGVGPMTVAMLMANTVEAARRAGRASQPHP